MQNIHDNKLLIDMSNDILRGILDNNEYITKLDPIKRITILKYIKILRKMDKLRAKFKEQDIYTYVEFFKETALTEEIGYFLLKNLRAAIFMHDKEQILLIINNIKYEIKRLSDQCEVDLGFKCEMKRRDAEEILRNYMGDKASESPFLEIYPAPATIIPFKPRNN